MQRLSKPAEILLMQFHEQKGDRSGAEAGQTLSREDFREAMRISPGIEFDGALEDLGAKGYVEKEGDSFYRLTEEGVEYLYAGATAGREVT